MFLEEIKKDTERVICTATHMYRLIHSYTTSTDIIKPHGVQTAGPRQNVSVSPHSTFSRRRDTANTADRCTQRWQRNKVRDKEPLCPALGVEGTHVLLRTSGLQATRGTFSEHRRYEKEGALCRSGAQVLKIEGKTHLKSWSESGLGRKKTALRLLIEAEW